MLNNAYVNPIAAARARGPVQNSGPTIQDYLSRPRPTWSIERWGWGISIYRLHLDFHREELKEQLEKKKKGSRALADFEDKMNDKWRKELAKNREKLLGGSDKDKKPSDKEKEKKDKKEKRKREKKKSNRHSSSSSSSSSDSSSSSSSESEDEDEKKMKKKRKRKKSSARKGPNTSEEESDAESKKKKRRMKDDGEKEKDEKSRSRKRKTERSYKDSSSASSVYSDWEETVDAKKERRSSEEWEKTTVRTISSYKKSPRRRGKRNTRNTAGERKRRQHLIQTLTLTDRRGPEGSSSSYFAFGNVYSSCSSDHT
ncbi:protein FAM133 isoform X3 [Takifugu rubripes]|uniref:protein FAM133 isoform X3 n=1 Tax=Takifugu rubripes TaxID=31033 RepID=UPI0011459D38|nr:protein FAM133B isoform X3 [Takifugu rubripes]XP_056877318.1 protein FAM133 isoform X3 [Takifugu flavidus]